MSTITLPNIRVGSDLQVRVRLKDGGVAIDWSTLQNIKACIYSDAQRALAGRCAFSIDEEDSTLLVCTYAANKPQYLGVNRIVISAKYMGETKTYDKPAFSFVRWTADQEGEEITIDDPDVDVEIDVEDISSSILQEAVDAAFEAADRANDAAAAAEHMVDIHTGPEGKSAYEVAVEEGYTGTEEEWLASLVGPQGQQGIQGETGEAAGFGTVSAALQEDGGDPSVVVAASGPDTAKQFDFTFKNLKGEKGDKGDQGNSGYTGAAGELEVVNNLTDGGAAKALSAEMGKTLEGEVSQLEAEVDGNYSSGFYLDQNGGQVSNSQWGVSEYIPYSSGNVVYKWNDDYSQVDGPSIIFYNSSKQVIDYFSCKLATAANGGRLITGIASGAAFIRASFLLGSSSYIKIADTIAWSPEIGLNKRISAVEVGLKKLDNDIITKTHPHYSIADGGNITFNPITLSQDGDGIEITVNTAVSSQNDGGYNFSNVASFGLGLTDRLYTLRWDDYEWGTTGYGYGAYYTNEDYTISIKYESGKVNVYLNGTLHSSYNSQKALTFNGIGCLTRTSYSNWVGIVKRYIITKNGESLPLNELPGLAMNNLVTVEAFPDKLNKDNILSPEHITQTNNQLYVIYRAATSNAWEKLQIFVPAKVGYIRYDFAHYADNTANVDFWGVLYASATDADLNKTLELTTFGNWECALGIAGVGFVGGFAHGNEILQDITLLIDGKETTISSLSSLKSCREVRIAGKYKIYNPSDLVNEICVHGMEHIFTMDGLSVKQYVDWKSECHLSPTYMTMFPSAKFGGDKIYKDIDYGVETLPASDFRLSYGDVCDVTVFNQNGFFANVRVPEKPHGLTGGDTFLVADNGGLSYNKMYFVTTTDAVIPAGTMWKVLTYYSINKTE